MNNIANLRKGFYYSTNAYQPNYSTTIIPSGILEESIIESSVDKLNFKPITHESMPEIWKILVNEPGRTTDFSYGGLLMWVDFFKYEYAIINNTLFISGRVENNLSEIAFSLPVGEMPVRMAINIILAYCRKNGINPVFSAIPEYAIPYFEDLNPTSIEPLDDWSDYLYSAEKLATLSGKKYSKKRNHINQFLSYYENDWSLIPLTARNAQEAMNFMDLIDKEGDENDMAIAERALNRKVLEDIAKGDNVYIGAIIKGKGEMLGFTVGDIKGDTLFVHIEKALRDSPGAFEMLNKSFAEKVIAEHPEIEYINREDDAGDEGLRFAKNSYHPVELLKKYNIRY